MIFIENRITIQSLFYLYLYFIYNDNDINLYILQFNGVSK